MVPKPVNKMLAVTHAIRWWLVTLASVGVVLAFFYPFKIQMMPSASLCTATFTLGCDKVVHAVAFMSLVLALRWAMVLSQRTPSIGLFTALVLGVGAFLGVTIEFLQPSVTRSCDVVDFVADVVGLVMACLVIWTRLYDDVIAYLWRGQLSHNSGVIDPPLARGD